jgi:hypothetical protein
VIVNITINIHKTDNHLSPPITQHKNDHGIWRLRSRFWLGQVQTCGSVKQADHLSNFIVLIIGSQCNDNTEIKKKGKNPTQICIHLNRSHPITIMNGNMNMDSTKGSSWLWSYGSLIDNYLCNQCLSPLMLWFRILLMQYSLSVTCGRSVVFSGYSSFLHQ